jgi:psiF repeat
MKIKTVLATFGVLALLSAGSAYAQTPAPAAKPAAAAKAKPERTAKSLECSKEADTKNIHGNARKKFMSKCKRA